ncbi:MAG: GntR family transcriptional regulator [Proteobacteria bacterium]|nr:GntR family transcriptional regulator [Pseudomonadota bacterium]MBU1585687.1 GntR family transcriptional regulator [Pseudomonadota bacterium]MBU2628702.1 GntR family transcriptional regulator [Pseudomonadota bacterium]
MKPSEKIIKIPKQPLAVIAYETIIKKIICLEYQPSQHLEENQLVEELGIGRTPIREALVRLQGEKMVESHPNRGVIVRPITLQNTKAMFESMHIFEFGVVDVAINKDCSTFIKKMNQSNEAVKKAILSNKVFNLVEANHDFHMNFAKCSQNEFLIRAVNDVRKEAKRLSFLSYNNIIDPKRPLEIHYKSVVQEHDQLIDSLCKKDETRLKQLLQEHIETFRQRIIIFMTS